MSRTLTNCQELYVNVTNSTNVESMQAPELVCELSHCHELHLNTTKSK